LFIALYIYEDFYPRASRLLEQEHHAALVQLKKHWEGLFCATFRNYSMMASEVLEDLRLLGYVELGGLSDLGPRDT
jgi:hypothetical protein